MKYALVLLAFCVSNALSQDSPHGEISLACETCHSTDSWSMRSDSPFSHASTRFKLTGRHETVHCASCHKQLKFAGTTMDCATCHTDVHRTELGSNCLRCHSTESWLIPDMRQRHQETRFPLVGKHLRATCESCHDRASSQRFSGTPLECIVCHESEYRSAQNPNHVTSGMSVDCSLCHSVSSDGWTGSFDHARTAFPLTGAHRAVQCSGCHTDNRFGKLATDCYSCHNTDFAQANNPSHTLYPHACTQCHSTTSWRPATFNHATTRFPLVGAHTATPCATCHVNDNYRLAFADCYQCHQDDFVRPSAPNHVSAGYSHDCTGCHSQSTWDGASFDHSTTRFPLVGAHVNKSCATCHVNGNYQLTYVECYQCHQTDFSGATNPNHVTGNYSHNCLQCHSQSTWDGASFDHNTTRFPLVGAHTSKTCATCHVNNNYQLTYTDCYACHQNDFTGATNPNHVTGNYSHNCLQCHSQSTWDGASFDHNTTRFPLVGAHTSKTCATCHVNNNYQLTYTDCYACHQNDFTGATNPNHVSGNYAHDCLQCHSQSSWDGASFNHSTTRFPLTGAHTNAGCVSCHTGGNYQLTFTDCYVCHQDDFSRPTNPNHVTAAFGHDCTPCHTTTTWLPSTFNHDQQYFRIYSGAHRGNWTLCSSCHPAAGNYSQFTCISCHEHNQASTNQDHTGVNNYVYASPSCYSCHRNS